MENLKEKIQSVINLYKSGNLVKTEEIVKKLIKENPNLVFLYNLLGLTLSAQNKIDEAIECYKNGIKVDPKYAMIYNNLGLLFFNRRSIKLGSKDYLKKAEDLYKQSISLDSAIPEPQTNLGNLYNLTNKHNDAIKHHKMAIQINPKFVYPYLNIANVYLSIGKFDQAKEYLVKAIEINPKFYMAHRILSRITKYKKDDIHLNQLKNLYKEIDEKDSENKMFLAFSLGKANEDIKNFEDSFLYYSKANSICRKKILFSIKKETQKFNEIKKSFNESLFNKFENCGNLDPSPIFIVGMPRSGTTLVEQILSSHSNVFGADEVDIIPELIRKYFGENKINLFLQNVFEFEKKDLKKMGEEYISRINEISNKTIRTTDKLPVNFTSIGLIKLILPKAKIVHTSRSPKDNIFSIFKNYFPAGKIPYAYSLEEIVQYYNLYFDLMKYWNKILPEFIFNIKYENLISDTKNEIIKLLDFCELSWEEECLNFYNNKRPIKTASDIQVRSKIFNTSIDYWKNYKKYLDKHYLDIKL